MYNYDTSVNSSENEKCFGKCCREEKHFMLINFVSENLPFLLDNVGKYVTARHATDDNGACALNAGRLKQEHTHTHT
jgi:hypothetical protein